MHFSYGINTINFNEDTNTEIDIYYEYKFHYKLFKKLFIYKFEKNLKSSCKSKFLSKNSLFSNTILRKGKKLSFLKNFNKFYEEFYLNILNNDFYENKINNEFIRYINEKKYLFNFNNLLIFLFSDNEIIFNIKKKKVNKNLKKLKRKPKKTQIIYIKKEKRFLFLIKLISIYLKKGKYNVWHLNFNDFLINDVINLDNNFLNKQKKIFIIKL